MKVDSKKELRQSVVLENQGKKLFAILHTPVGVAHAPLVIILHGFASSKVGAGRIYVQLAEALIEGGIAALRFDMRGCGDSEGHISGMSFEDYLSDFSVVSDYVENEGFKKVGLFGSSFGGAVAVYGALKSSLVASLVLWAPVASGKLWHEDWKTAYPDDALGSFRGLEINSHFREQFGKMDAAGQMEQLGNIPLLHFHGETDTIIPLHHQHAFEEHRKKAAARTQFVTYPHTDHTLGLSKVFPEVISKTVKWFQETL